MKLNSWEKRLSIELPNIDYIVNSSHPDPAADLLRQQEDALVEALHVFGSPDFRLGVPRITFGKSLYDVQGEHLTIDTMYQLYLKYK